MDLGTLASLAVISPKTGEEMSIASLAIPNGDALYGVLTVLSGIFWTIAYILIIYRGHKDKVSGMPLMVLGLNWAWEFIFCFLGAPIVPAGSALDLTWQTPIQRVMNGMWFVFDCVIMYQKFKYGREEYKSSMPHAPDWAYYPYLIGIILISTGCVLFSINEWGDHNGVYAAYIQNIFISATFISMLFRRGNSKGQNMGIAICKCLGTLAPSLMGALVMVREYGATWSIFVDFKFMPLMKFLIECCFLFDVIYIVALYYVMKHVDHVDPWSRKPLPESEWKTTKQLAEEIAANDPDVFKPEYSVEKSGPSYEETQAEAKAAAKERRKEKKIKEYYA